MNVSTLCPDWLFFVLLLMKDHFCSALGEKDLIFRLASIKHHYIFCYKAPGSFLWKDISIIPLQTDRCFQVRYLSCSTKYLPQRALWTSKSSILFSKLASWRKRCYHCFISAGLHFRNSSCFWVHVYLRNYGRQGVPKSREIMDEAEA